ncbi:MAG: hypothetical protein ABFS46_09930 [Myxococcota bacterium]
MASFRFTYVAIFVFLLLYVFSVQLAETLLDAHYREAVAQAAQGVSERGSVVANIRDRVDGVLGGSPWTGTWGVQVTPIVLGADGSILYVGGHAVPTGTELDPVAALEEAQRVLPASTDIVTTVPHGALLANAILVLYAGLLVQLLFVRSRAQARREAEQLRLALEARDQTSQRAQRIEGELESVRSKLAEVAPEREGHAEEIRQLQRERGQLQGQLDALASREAALRLESHAASGLQEEHQALEELLDEALQDLSGKETEIRSLETKLKRASRSRSSQSRGREAEQLGRRLRTLYKNLEVDERAVADLVGLGDESLKLKAEENLKRLSDDADNAAVRRKVGGLPPYLAIFELGFAGKGRIYYTRGHKRRFRVLLVGAKNTQKTDLEYLSRLPRE